MINMKLALQQLNEYNNDICVEIAEKMIYLDESQLYDTEEGLYISKLFDRAIENIASSKTYTCAQSLLKWYLKDVRRLSDIQDFLEETYVESISGIKVLQGGMYQHFINEMMEYKYLVEEIIE